MEPGRRRPHRAAAALGLLVGLTLLCGAVLDGGLSTPSRQDVRDPVAAERSGDAPATGPVASREDLPSWERLLSPTPTGTTTAMLALVLATVLAVLVSAPPAPPARLLPDGRGPPAR